LTSLPASASFEPDAVAASMAGDVNIMTRKERGDNIPSEDWDVVSGGPSLSMAANVLINDGAGSVTRAGS